MYDNRGNSTPYQMTEEETKQFEKGIKEVERQVRENLTSDFTVNGVISQTPQQTVGVMNVVTPLNRQMNFNITPREEFFTGRVNMSDSDQIDEISNSITAAMVSGLLQVNDDLDEYPAN